MFAEEDGPGETAVAFTDQFLDGAVAKLDGLFGEGYAKEHPVALAAYISACASNLDAFMTAATAVQEGAGFGDALMEAMLEFDEPAAPPPPPRGRGRKKS